MTLLDATRDRGENQPIRMTDTSGRAYVVKFGESLRLANPEYEEQAVGATTEIKLSARTLQEARTLLGRVKAKHPAFDIDEAMAQATKVQTWPDGMLHHQLQIGPRVVFPGLFASASIFAVYQGHPEHPELESYVARFDPANPEMPPGTFYFAHACPWITAPGELTHIVALFASAARKELLIYLELFNAVSVGVTMPYNGLEDSRATYAVDILEGTEVKANVVNEGVVQGPWLATHKLGDDELYRLTQERIGRVIGLSQERAFRAQVTAFMKQAFGGGDRPADAERGHRWYCLFDRPHAPAVGTAGRQRRRHGGASSEVR